MSTTELLQQLKQLNNAERLSVIEAATRLIRHDLVPEVPAEHSKQESRIREAATRIKDSYEPGGELTEWTSLDGEDFADEHVPR